ncbi:zinc-binding dehydrogenase [Nocardia sp. NPDC051052]
MIVETGRLRPLDRVLPLELAAEAHELSHSGRVVGKIVLTVD